jgi:hypothetical protein
MSVAALKAALSGKTGTKLAVVSEDLFFDLIAADEIEGHISTFNVPSDPKYKVVIDNLLMSMGVNPNAPVPFTHYMMRHYPGLHVQLDHQHSMLLSQSGPNSFMIF